MMFQTIFSQNIVSDTIFHEVNRKETLFSISQKYDININDILELKTIFNDIKNADFSIRKSSNNKFSSISITAVMKTPISIIEKYKLASKIKGIISL